MGITAQEGSGQPGVGAVRGPQTPGQSLCWRDPPLAVSHTLRKAPIEALMKQNWAYPGGKKQDGGV